MKTLSKGRIKREFSKATTTSVCFLRHSHKSMWGKAVQASRYMCMLLNWIKKFQLPLNGPNLPSSSPSVGLAYMELLAEQAYLSWLDLLALVIKKAARKSNAEMQPTKWIHYYSWLVACRYKTHGSNDKSQKFTRRLLFPFHQMMFCELRPSHFRQSQKLKASQVSSLQARKQGRVEQREKFCMGSFFAQFVVWYTRVAYFIFALKTAIRCWGCVRPLLIFDTRYFKSQLLLQMT